MRRVSGNTLGKVTKVVEGKLVRKLEGFVREWK